MDSQHFEKATKEHLSSLMTRYAMEGLELLHRFCSNYTARYITPMLAFCFVHLCDTVLQINKEDDISRAVSFCLTSLSQAHEGFPFLGPLMAMFAERIVQHGHRLPDEFSYIPHGNPQYGLEEKLDTCERLTYNQPTDQLIGRLDPSIGREFDKEWEVYIEKHGGAEPHSHSESSAMRDRVGTPSEAGDAWEAASSVRSTRTSGSPSTRAMAVDSLVN